MPTQGQFNRIPSYWQSPELGEFKLNCDEAVTSGGESACAGVLLDDKVSQPTLRREGDAGLTGASSKGGRRVESPPTFIQGKRRKNRNVWSMNFKCERFRSCFYTRGRY